MQQKIYSVYDKAIGAYMQPFFVRSKGEAIRSFMQACSDPKMPFGTHPGDYTLYELGDYDDVSGSFACHDPIRILTALEATAIEGEVR